MLNDQLKQDSTEILENKKLSMQDTKNVSNILSLEILTPTFSSMFSIFVPVI